LGSRVNVQLHEFSFDFVRLHKRAPFLALPSLFRQRTIATDL
jgi:hypothetical protein